MISQRFTRQAPAKLNLFLELLGERPDGFHEILTFAVPIGFYDTIEFEPGEGNVLDLKIIREEYFDDEEFIPDGESNSVCKAIRFMQRYVGKELGGRVTLHKRIPSQAGLGGGTSDAATALLLIDSAYDLRIPREELAAQSVVLGSDVPLFIHSQPVVCRGQGELTEPVSGLPTYHFAVLVPEPRLSTAAVFKQYDRMEHTSPKTVEPVLEAARSGELPRFASHLFNRLENAALELCPDLDNVRKTLEEFDCPAVRMSGSGTAFFALCRDREESQKIADKLKESNLGVAFAAESLS